LLGSLIKKAGVIPRDTVVAPEEKAKKKVKSTNCTAALEPEEDSKHQAIGETNHQSAIPGKEAPKFLGCYAKDLKSPTEHDAIQQAKEKPK